MKSPRKLGQLNDYHKQQNEKALKAVQEMMKHPPTREEVLAQLVRLFKSNMNLTPEEEVIWNNTELTEFQRIGEIKDIRIVKKRAEYELQKLQDKENGRGIKEAR